MNYFESIQFIRFPCKICGRVFNNVPYEHIVHHRIAQCSSCGARFILDREELQAALIAALDENTDLTEGTQAPLPDTQNTNTIDHKEFREPAAEESPPSGEDDSEKSLEIESDETLERAEPDGCAPAGTPGTAEPLAVDADKTLDIDEPEDLDSDSRATEDHETPSPEPPRELENEKTLKIFAAGQSAAEEPITVKNPPEDTSEETLVLEPAETLEIDELEDLDAEDSLDIEDFQRPASADSHALNAEDTLEIDEPEDLDAENSLDIEDSQEPASADSHELDAEDTLEIDEPEDLDAEDSLDIEEYIKSADESQTTVPEATTLQPPVVENSPAGTAGATHPAEGSRAALPDRADFAPETENKLEFARRLSCLIPEGWVGLPQDRLSPPLPGSAQQGSIIPDINPHAGHHQLLVFMLGTTECAAPIENTTEIGMLPELTRVPHVPAWLMGIINLRGDILPVIDIRNFLGMGPFEADRNDRIILLRSVTEDIRAAIIVNHVAGMHYIEDNDIILSDADQQAGEPYMRGAYEFDGRLIAVLDIESMLLSDDMQQFRSL